MAYYLVDENGKKVETTLDVLKAKSKAMHDEYYSKYGDTWSQQNSQGFSAAENADGSIPLEEMQLIGYYDNAPIYSSGSVGSGTGTFVNGKPYYSTYYQIDDKGNFEQGELKKYNEHWYEKLLKQIPRAGAIGVGGAIGGTEGAALVAGLTSLMENNVRDEPWGDALKRAAIEAVATYAGGEAIGALGEYASGAGGTGALSEEAFYLAESEGVSAYNSALAQGLGEEAAQAAYTESFNSAVSGVTSGGSGSDNLSGDTSEDQLTNTSEGTDVSSEPLTGSVDSGQSYSDMLNNIAGTEVSESTWNALPATTTGGLSWLDAIKAGLILAPVIAGATASTGDTTASATTTTNKLPTYTQPTAEKLFFDFIDDFYGTGDKKSVQERTTEDTDYLNNLSKQYVTDSGNAVSGYQGLLSDILNQANTGTGYYTPISFGFGGKKMASFVPKANRSTVDQILNVGQQEAGVNQGLVDLGYNEAKTTTPNEAANSYSKSLGDLMTKLIGGTSTATTTGTVDNSSQTLTNILSGANTAAKLLEALTKWSSTST